MKTIGSRAPAVQAKQSRPFFGKKEGDGGFFRQGLAGGDFFVRGNGGAVKVGAPGGVASGKTGGVAAAGAAPVQARLTVGKPNDVYEKEADAMADRVVQRMKETPVQKGAEKGVKKGAEKGGKPAVEAHVQRSAEDSVKGSVESGAETGAKGVVENSAQHGMERSVIKGAESGIQRAAAAMVVAAAPTAAPAVQEQCAQCEDEKKKEQEEDEALPQGKLRKKPIFESNAEPPDEDEPIRRKCPACMEDEQISKKGDGTSSQTAPPAVESGLKASKGGGAPLPDQTRGKMESSFGRDLGNVRIHNDSSSAAMNKSLRAQAFTHGNDIYFNSGKYDPGSRSGQHLLAHELTHTVQQGEGTVRKASYMRDKDSGFSKVDYYWNFRHEVVELMGNGIFNPSDGLALYISSQWDDGFGVPVQIRFGNLARGVLQVFPQSPDYPQSEDDDFFDVTIDETPSAEDYYAPVQVIPFHHPDLDAVGLGGTTVLIIKIDQGRVWGGLGWIDGKSEHEIDPMQDWSLARSGPDDFVKLIFGKEHAGRKFTANGPFGFFNYLDDGSLSFLMDGDLELDHEQKLDGFFALKDGTSAWIGNIKTDIQGAAPYDLPIERTKEGYLSAARLDLALDGQWKSGKLTVNGGLNISYASANLTITGTVDFSYQDRMKGQATIVLTDREQGQELFLQHVPGRAVDPNDTPDNIEAAIPDPQKRLALVAWGNLNFKFIDKKQQLDGSVAFAVSPEGYVVTVGQVRFKQRLKLAEIAKNDKFKSEDHNIEETVVVPVLGVPVPVTGSLKAHYYAGYDIGNIWFVDLTASGAFSTHPKYLSEFCLSGTFDIAAKFWAGVKASIRISIGPSETLSLAQAGFDINAKGTLNVYVRAKPSIGIVKQKDKGPDYCIGGKLYAGGQMKLTLTGDFKFTILHFITNDDGEKKEDGEVEDHAAGKEWTLGEFAGEATFNYVLGGDEKPKLSYKGVEFDEAGFADAALHDEEEKSKGPEREGGFQDEGETREDGTPGKEEGHYSKAPFKPVHPEHEPVGTHPVTDDFSMNGQSHLLILTVSGTDDAPKVQLEMQSKREPVLVRVTEERILFESALEEPGLTDRQKKVLEQGIRDLRAMEAEADRVLDQAAGNVSNITQADLVPLATMMEKYAKRFGRPDLGGAAGPLPQGTGQAPGTAPASGTPATPAPGGPPTPGGPKIPRPPGVTTPTGDTKDDPIDIEFYKDPADYRTIILQGKDREYVFEFGQLHTFEIPDMMALRRYPDGKYLLRAMTGNQIKFGASRKRIPVPGRTIWQKQRSDWRLSDPQKGFRVLMELHGHQMENEDADHVRDLQFLGPDDFDNLWPLNSRINRSNNRFLDHRVKIFDTSDGTEKEVRLGDPIMYGKFFRIIGFRHY